MTVLTVDNSEYSPKWKATDDSTGVQAVCDGNNDFFIQNEKSGKKIELWSKDSGGNYASLSLREDPAQSERAQLDLYLTDQGAKLTLGGEIEIHGKGSSGGKSAIFIGDSSNSKNAQGLTINQGGNDDEILSLKSSDVAHGMTSLTETDTYAIISKLTTDSGGLNLEGFSEDKRGVFVRGNVSSQDTTKSNASTGCIFLTSAKKSGTGRGSMPANSNLLVVRNLSQTRFILDADGDSHQDVGTTWTNFDSYDDATLLNDLAVAFSQSDDPIKSEFRKFVTYNRDVLEQAKLATFNEDGHHFVNMSKLTMLLVGAVRQQARQIHQQVERITQLETAINKLSLKDGSQTQAGILPAD
jgi:hypothetical protein